MSAVCQDVTVAVALCSMRDSVYNHHSVPVCLPEKTTKMVPRSVAAVITGAFILKRCCFFVCA